MPPLKTLRWELSIEEAADILILAETHPDSKDEGRPAAAALARLEAMPGVAAAKAGKTRRPRTQRRGVLC